jgi:flagellin-like hook-associated protein FlgL
MPKENILEEEKKMALSNITLTAGMRANLLALQNTQNLFEVTQTRLATGKKVNTALDDPVAYFSAKAYGDRANDLAALKDNMNEAIQTVKAADAGISAIEDLIAQAKSLATSALSTQSTTERASYATQFGNLLSQIDYMALDANYKGTDLLDGDPLVVNFNEDSTSSLTITGFTASSSSLGIAAAGGNWAADADINTSIGQLDTASTSLRTESKNLSSNLAVVNTRLEFTTNMINTLTKGAENLTLADMNEEGANLLMLQTRQALSTTALSLASQAAQSVLRLF